MNRILKIGTVIAIILLSVSVGIAAAANHYDQTNLVSDLPDLAKVQDQNLVNPWGLTRSPTGPWLVSDNGMGVATSYDKDGNPFPIRNPLTVTIPPKGSGTPTGIVFNGGSDFEIKKGEPARFIFVTEDGTISGWNPAENQNAIEKVNNGPDAVYKGATIAKRDDGKNYLYVANFRGGTVDVFDKSFKKIDIDFKDDKIPKGYAPFNIKNIDGKLFVTFAKQDVTKHDDVKGKGFGFVDVFSPNGKLLMKLEHGSWDNGPWGIALAPKGFCGHNREMLLVGNFGSGKIAMFEYDTGNFHGFLQGEKGRPLVIDGLWGLEFGNGGIAGPKDTLFFTAGIQAEAHGLFGKITVK